MRYLIDTCILSSFVKGDLNILSRIKQLSPQDIAISSVTIMEVEYGILHMPTREFMNIKDVMQDFIKLVNIIAFDHDIAVQAAHIKSNLSRDKIEISDYDLLIGATAKYHNLIIASNNTIFEHIEGLQIESW